MDSEFNPLKELGPERRRQMQIRQTIKGAIEQTKPGDDSLAALFEACAEYIIVSMGRLDLTDMNIHDLLRERVSRDVTEVHDGLDVLGERQKKARAEIATLAAALDAYKSGGRKDFAAFDAAMRHNHDVMTSMMSPRKNPYGKYTDELFTLEDWADIAEANDDTIATEARLFDGVTAAAPDELKPDSFSGTHGLRPS